MSLEEQVARVCETGWCLTQLRHCMFIRTRTQAYLEKCLGADFYKLPRPRVMRILSEIRESIVWILKLLFE